jgi:hypothetical protein
MITRKNIETALWRWTIRKLRLLMDAVDDWLHAEEMKIRVLPAPVATQGRTDEFQIAASRAREKQTKKARPRLRYQGGQFVREGA